MDKTTGQINQALEQAMLEKLYKAWELAERKLGRNEPLFAKRLKRPSIVIWDMKKTLGMWDPFLKEIRMARHLVKNGRWDSVVEVLHHEMAHQLASSFPEYTNETSHGRLFLECCKALRANPKASGSYKTLEERIWGEDESDQDRIMVKVKKLMGLASSKNPHEAALAAAKAGELIARYNLESIRSNETRNFESIIITHAGLKRTQSESLGAIILNEHYFVEPVWISVYVPEKKKMGTALEINGTPTNLKIADYVFSFLLKYAQNSWLDYKAANPSCRSKSGYMTGVVNGFRETLDKSKQSFSQKEKSRGNSLVLLKDHQLDAHVTEKYPDLQTCSFSHGSMSRDAYNSGLSEGRNLVISKAITSNGGNSGKLIGR